jgi:cytochrome c-type biogenesis protein CcmH/NrfG
MPIISKGVAEFKKKGLFSVLEEKDYGNTAYQAIYKSVKDSTDEFYEALKNPKAQIVMAKEEIKKNPSNTFPYRVVANLSLKNNDIAEALAAAQMHIQLDPKNYRGYFLLYKPYSCVNSSK